MLGPFARRLTLVVPAMAAGAFALAAPATARAQLLRYKTTQPGDVVVVGNTLGLAKAANENGPGTSDSIGTFISLDPTSSDVTPAVPANPWGPRTTSDWTKNGSSAKLALPHVDAQVLYAELVWGGSYKYGGEDVTLFLDVPVRLEVGNDAIQPKPDPITKSTLDYFATGINADAEYYTRSADVTAFVQAHPSGVYSVSGVPATQATTVNALGAAGWALVVAYRRDGDPIRTMSVLVGNGDRLVDAAAVVDYEVGDFCAPSSGVVNGTVAVAALEGDANQGGDKLLVGADPLGSFVGLSGPNNRPTNFFASQINDANGALDTSGTFGTRNHDAVAGANVSGGRQGWDVTNVRLSSSAGQLTTGQRYAVVRAATTGDSFLPVLAGIAIDAHGPRFSHEGSVATASPMFASPGQRVTVTARLANEGTASADGVRFSLALPAGVSLASFAIGGASGNAAHQTVAQAELAAGVAIGAVAAGAARTVQLELLLDAAAASPLSLKPVWGFDYVSCADGAPAPEEFHARTVTIAVRAEPAAPQADAGADAGLAPAEPAVVADEGGGCATSPAGSSPPASALATIALAAAALVARRRSCAR